MIIGIDLGTTNSVAAYMAENGPQLIPNSLGEFLTPSVVGLDTNGELLVGRAAVELQVSYPDRCASLFKRHMGGKHEYRLDNQVFTAETLSSLVLKSLKADAEALFGHPVTKAVITVPAYFNDNQRKATIQAGQLAGLEVVRILNEPTAAAIAYGLQDAGASKLIAVFDLGGGTFDVSIVEMFEGSIEVRASSGESFLGGEDFTRTIAARVLERQGLVFERVEMTSPRLISRLIQQCERAKRQLTSREQAEIRIPDTQGELSEQSPSVILERKDFQQFTESILGRIEIPIRRCLGDAKLTRSDIDEIILVGGATRMPAVMDRVEELFQKRPQYRLNPDEVVALGAAVQAGLIGNNRSLEELVVTDVCPFTLGIGIAKQFGSEHRAGYFMSIINRNTTIPVSRAEQVSTIYPGQTEVSVKVYQGDARRVEDNLLLGEFTVKGIPTSKQGQPIDIRFTYDLNGVLEVEATVVATKAKASLVITRYAGELTPAQVKSSLEQMAALKHHPREEMANRFLLKRAERVFRELPRDERDLLGQMLDAFENMLDRQDTPTAIEELRLEITTFLNRFDPPDEQNEEPA